MRVLYPRVHEATRRLLRRIGFAVKQSSAGCCGALHAHNGQLSKAIEMAESAGDEMKENLPVIVNSAGCGSFLKDHSSFSKRTFDVSEFLITNGLIESLHAAEKLNKSVTYHDACHLAHGQRITDQPRELLRAIPGIELVEMNEADRCCGSAGIYNLLQPKMARALLERKWANVEFSGAEIVALGNPGCHAWIEQATRERNSRIQVLHTMEVLEASFSGLPAQVL
jgi:glycolate oxidase iron-sulfur subunit